MQGSGTEASFKAGCVTYPKQNLSRAVRYSAQAALPGDRTLDGLNYRNFSLTHLEAAKSQISMCQLTGS